MSARSDAQQSPLGNLIGTVAKLLPVTWVISSAVFEAKHHGLGSVSFPFFICLRTRTLYVQRVIHRATATCVESKIESGDRHWRLYWMSPIHHANTYRQI